MDRAQMAKIVEWTGTLRGRKRLQKVVCLLQAAGCKLEADFFLHHYGPYSRDVADTCDEMTAVGLLKESTRDSPAGYEYSYELTPRAKALLEQAERHPRFKGALDEVNRYKPLGEKLLSKDVPTLELASTIAHMYRTQRKKNWDKAVQKACEFKKVEVGSTLARNATGLAREVADWGQ